MNNYHLTVEEAHRKVQLLGLLETERERVIDFLLLRASLSNTKSERKAWYMLVALISWIERNHRFPHLKEQTEYLAVVLEGSEAPELPSLQFGDLIHSGEIEEQARSSLRIKQKDD
jgi:hypothetical protein